MSAFPCPISGDFDCADDCCVAPPRRHCPRMFDRAFAAMEKPEALVRDIRKFFLEVAPGAQRKPQPAS